MELVNLQENCTRFATWIKMGAGLCLLGFGSIAAAQGPGVSAQIDIIASGDGIGVDACGYGGLYLLVDADVTINGATDPEYNFVVSSGNDSHTSSRKPISTPPTTQSFVAGPWTTDPTPGADTPYGWTPPFNIITMTIYTYASPDAENPIYSSSITVDCTDTSIVEGPSGGPIATPPTSVPVMGWPGLVVLSLLLGAVGARRQWL